MLEFFVIFGNVRVRDFPNIEHVSTSSESRSTVHDFSRCDEIKSSVRMIDLPYVPANDNSNVPCPSRNQPKIPFTTSASFARRAKLTEKTEYERNRERKQDRRRKEARSPKMSMYRSKDYQETSRRDYVCCERRDVVEQRAPKNTTETEMKDRRWAM